MQSQLVDKLRSSKGASIRTNGQLHRGQIGRRRLLRSLLEDQRICMDLCPCSWLHVTGKHISERTAFVNRKPHCKAARQGCKAAIWLRSNKTAAVWRGYNWINVYILWGNVTQRDKQGTASLSGLLNQWNGISSGLCTLVGKFASPRVIIAGHLHCSTRSW